MEQLGMTQGRNLSSSPTWSCVQPGSHSHLYPSVPGATVQFPFPHATVLQIELMTGAKIGASGEKKSSAVAAVTARSATSAAARWTPAASTISAGWFLGLFDLCAREAAVVLVVAFPCVGGCV